MANSNLQLTNRKGDETMTRSAKLLIILALLVGFLYGWWQGYNAGVEYMEEDFWDDVTEQTELKI